MPSATTTLIEATDDDFEWMIRGVAVRNRGLSLPPGGVDSKGVLALVRSRARTLLRQWGRTATWMIVANDEVAGLCGYKYPPSVEGAVDIGYGVAASKRRRGYAKGAGCHPSIADLGNRAHCERIWPRISRPIPYQLTTLSEPKTTR